MLVVRGVAAVAGTGIVVGRNSNDTRGWDEQGGTASSRYRPDLSQFILREFVLLVHEKKKASFVRQGSDHITPKLCYLVSRTFTHDTRLFL